MKIKHLFSLVLFVAVAFCLQAQDRPTLTTTPTDDEVVVKTVREGSGSNIQKGQDVELHAVFSDADGKVQFDSRDLGFPIHRVVGKDDSAYEQAVDGILMDANKGGIYEATIPRSKLDAEDTKDMVGDHIALRIMVIDFAPASPNGADAIQAAIKEAGVDAGSAAFTKIRMNKEDDHKFYQWDMNRLGYDLLQEEKTDAAVAVFKMNTDLFPASANACDSLGDGYLAAGDKEKAALCFENALELDPDFDASRDKLQKLRDEAGGEKD